MKNNGKQSASKPHSSQNSKASANNLPDMQTHIICAVKKVLKLKFHVCEIRNCFHKCSIKKSAPTQITPRLSPPRHCVEQIDVTTSIHLSIRHNVALAREVDVAPAGPRILQSLKIYLSLSVSLFRYTHTHIYAYIYIASIKEGEDAGARERKRERETDVRARVGF